MGVQGLLCIILATSCKSVIVSEKKVKNNKDIEITEESMSETKRKT